MKAIEARELANSNRINIKELEDALSRIRGSARQGNYQEYFVDLSQSTKDELMRLGYCVTSEFHRNESNDNVTWYELKLK